MRRIIEHLISCSLLDNAAAVEHDDARGHLPNDPEVVSDEQERRSLLIHLAQQSENLGLDRDVQRCNRLVAHEHLRIHGERTSNCHSLTLAT